MHGPLKTRLASKTKNSYLFLAIAQHRHGAIVCLVDEFIAIGVNEYTEAANIKSTEQLRCLVQPSPVALWRLYLFEN